MPLLAPSASATAASIAHLPESPTVRRTLLPADRPGCMADVLRLLGLPEDTAAETAECADLPVPIWRIAAGATLWMEGSLATTLCVVHAGTFKRSKVYADGYEQVLGIAARGDLLGFGGLAGGHQPVTVTALETSSVYALPMRDLDALRRRHHAIDRAVLLAASREQARAGEQAALMAAVMAEVRLARFLVWQSRRMAERGQSPRRLLLRMSRRDIASLLGVAHETVSRSFTMLAQAGLVRTHNRDVELVDLEGLSAFAANTRGLHELPGTIGPGRAAAPARTHAAPSRLPETIAA